MATYTKRFTFGYDDRGGEAGWIPEFFHGAYDYEVGACQDATFFAHDVIEHESRPNEGDAQTELEAVGSFLAARYHYDATSPAVDTIAADVAGISRSGGLAVECDADVDVDRSTRAGVRKGIRELVDEARMNDDDDVDRERAIEAFENRRAIERSIERGSERFCERFGSSDFGYEAFQVAKDAFEVLALADAYEGLQAVVTVNEEDRTVTVGFLCDACEGVSDEPYCMCEVDDDDDE